MAQRSTTARVATGPGYDYRPGELLVLASATDQVAGELADLGFHRVDDHGPVVRYRGPENAPIPELVTRFDGLAEPNHVYAAAGDRAIGAAGSRTAAGDRAIGGFGAATAVPSGETLVPLTRATSTVVVGLIDTGIVLESDNPHTWFGDSHLEYGLGDDDPLDVDRDGLLDASDGHGTFIAGLILHEAPQVKVKTMRVLDSGVGDDTAIAAAIGLLAMDDRITLINLSFGGVAAEDSPPRVLEYALAQLPPEVVVICSAGNFGDRRPHWPAAFTRVTTVGAANLADEPVIAPFSSRGPWVDAYAEGVGVLGPYCRFIETSAGAAAAGVLPQEFTGWARWSGTSFAAATVTGRIAALMAPANVHAKRLTAVQARDKLLGPDAETIDDGTGRKVPLIR